MLPGLGLPPYSYDDEPDRPPGPPREYHVSPVKLILVFIIVIALLGYFVVLPRNVELYGDPTPVTEERKK